MTGMHGLALVIALVLNAAANLLIKIGMTRVAANGGLLADGVVGAIVKVVASPVLVIGLTCFGLNAACYMFALQSRALKISLAYPIMVGGGFAIIAVVGYVWLGERLTALQSLGVGLVLAGAFLIAVQTETVVK